MEKTVRQQSPPSYIQFMIAPGYRVYRHMLLLGVFAVVACIVPVEAHSPYVILIRLGILAFSSSLIYLNIYYLTPKFLFRNKYLQYIGALILCGVIAFLLAKAVHWGPHHNTPYKKEEVAKFNNGALLFIFNTVVFIAATTSIKLFQQWIKDAQRITELEHATRFAELEQLKNQINPHFLFNMLNNTNVLTQKDPEKASQILIKLSDFLRYQLYDSARPQVLLTSEIRFLEDFLALEKIRRDNFQFSLSKEGDLTGVQVAPLMFITFVENAAKHSLDTEMPSYVDVRITVHNNVLRFECVNSKPSTAFAKTGGLGLLNVQRRLALLYPEKHTLNISNDVDKYSVTLTISL